MNKKLEPLTGYPPVRESYTRNPRVIDAHYSVGIKLGFPECCTRYFSDNLGRHALIRGEYPLKGTGFIPCVECSNTYNDIELTDIINSRRTIPVPFPYNGSINEFVRN